MNLAVLGNAHSGRVLDAGAVEKAEPNIKVSFLNTYSKNTLD